MGKIISSETTEGRHLALWKGGEDVAVPPRKWTIGTTGHYLQADREDSASSLTGFPNPNGRSLVIGGKTWQTSI